MDGNETEAAPAKSPEAEKTEEQIAVDEAKAKHKAEMKEAQKEAGKIMPSGSIKALVPKTFDEACAMAKMLAGSDVVPKEMRGRPANVLLAIMHGLELGVSPAQALQNIMVVNGRPSIWGDLALALVRKSGLLEEFHEDPADVTLKNGVGRCFAKRKGDKKGVEYRFTKEMAETANLLRKQGPWQEYRGRMYMMRARSWLLRDLFGDVLKGLAIVEEQRDIMRDVTPGAPAAVPMPQRKAAAVREGAIEGQGEKPAKEIEQPKPDPEKKPESSEKDRQTSTFKVKRTVASTVKIGKSDIPVFFIYPDHPDAKKFVARFELIRKEADKAKKEGKAIKVTFDDTDIGQEIELIEIVQEAAKK